MKHWLKERGESKMDHMLDEVFFLLEMEEE